MYSSLKNWILAKTHYVIDISHRAQFPQLQKSFKALSQLSKDQRGLMDSHSIIDETTIGKMFGFISYLADLVMSRGTENYDSLVAQLPFDQRFTYHSLLQSGILFFLYFFSMGSERKDTWPAEGRPTAEGRREAALIHLNFPNFSQKNEKKRF